MEWLLAAGLGILVVLTVWIKNAPEGYEDEMGFHIGRWDE